MEQNMYILKQSDGTIWSFKYDIERGIVYKTCKGEIWSNYSILIKEAKEKFSATILPNDSICVVYEDLDGNLMLHIFNHINWKAYYLMHNCKEDIFNIYFRTVLYKNRLFLFYSIYHKGSNKITIVFQTIDGTGNLSSPSLIDDIYFHYDIPFYLHVSSENVLYIMYQKYKNNHELGYRLLSADAKSWSEFYVIDDCSLPFVEYSLLAIENKIHSLYIKKDEESIYSITYCRGNPLHHNRNNIWSGHNIISCAFFIINKHIWCLWMQNNQIYSTVSIDHGEVFSIPPQAELIETSSIFKATYISNFQENKRNMYIGEIFVVDNNNIECLVVDNICGIVHSSNKSNKYLFYTKYLINKSYKSDKDLEEKDILIVKLKQMVEEQKIKLQYCENKLKTINNSMANFNENKNQLNEGISFLQDSLIIKEKRLNELEALYVEKEEELELLRQEVKNMKKKKSYILNLKRLFSKIVSSLKNILSLNER